jgi:flavin-dependent dehydrogenase
VRAARKREREGTAAVLPFVAVMTLSRTPVNVIGGGLAAIALATRLARRGWRPALLAAGPAEPSETDPDSLWLPASATLARDLPSSAVLETAMPVDVVLAGDYPVATRARVALIDVAALRRTWRRRATIAGAQLVDGIHVEGVVRGGGRVTGVRVAGSEDYLAPLTIDVSGRGVILGSLYGAALGRDRLPDHDTELVAVARATADPRRIDPAWVGRLQLLLGLDQPGALGLRGATRDGCLVVAAVTLGAGGTRDALHELATSVLSPCVEPAEVVIHTRRLPCRRPLDVIGADGMAAFGAAAAIHDSLLGLDVELLLRAADHLAPALDPCLGLTAPGKEDLFAASRAVHHAVGGTLVQRLVVRRALDGWSAAEREALVLGGPLGPAAWFRAIDGASPLWTAASLSTRRLPSDLRRQWNRLLQRAAALRVHYALYPRRYDMFAIDRWQARIERLLERP